jgi:hypothetical protein
MMNALIQRILQNNLTELKGLSIEGEIPVSEDFLNDLIKFYISNMSKPGKDLPPTHELHDEGPILHLEKLINNLDKKDITLSLKEKQALIKISIKKN